MNICPNPGRWNEIYEVLLAACKHRNIGSLPPVPLILNGWLYSNDADKADRWKRTESWAQENGLSELVAVSVEDWYAVEYPFRGTVGPLGGPMYLPWKFEPVPAPDAATVKTALTRIMQIWADVAGELSRYTRPSQLTGAKCRRLVVLRSASAPPPPWGDWNRLADDDSRRKFTKLRQSINAAIAPVEIDHIDFVSVSDLQKQVLRGIRG